jgi:hypothetical protein
MERNMIVDHIELFALANRIITAGGSSPAEAAIVGWIGSHGLPAAPVYWNGYRYLGSPTLWRVSFRGCSGTVTATKN